MSAAVNFSLIVAQEYSKVDHNRAILGQNDAATLFHMCRLPNVHNIG